MISSLHGLIEAIGPDWVVVNVGGVGFHVHMPATALARLGVPGDRVHLHTQLVMREDSLALYGFIVPEDLRLFQVLTGVSGVGPRLGLAMLSAMSVERLSAAIAGGDTNVLRTVPGIGKKVAERLVLELKDKIGSGGLVVSTGQAAQAEGDVVIALTSLGYSSAEAGRAIASIEAPSGSSLEERVRLALSYLGSERRS